VLKPNFNSWNIKSNSEFEFQKQTVKPLEVHYKRIPNICREKKRKKKKKESVAFRNQNIFYMPKTLEHKNDSRADAARKRMR
jgi:hypothetical protein